MIEVVSDPPCQRPNTLELLCLEELLLELLSLGDILNDPQYRDRFAHMVLNICLKNT
jgi:hypothetical protein